MKNPYKENPFSLLGLSPLASKEEIIKKAREILPKIFIDEIPELSEEQVIKAKNQLLSAESRLQEEIFFSSPESLIEQELYTLLTFWKNNPYDVNNFMYPLQNMEREALIGQDFIHPDIPDIPLYTDGSEFDTSHNKSSNRLEELPCPEFELKKE